MRKDEILNKVTLTINRLGFKLRKRSPEILIAVGVVGVVTSTVMACRATTKLNDILEESNDQLEGLRECSINEDVSKAIAKVYVQTGVKCVKLYAPAVILGTVSLGSIIASNSILHKRNTALAAAYATVDKSYKLYRSRVAEHVGEEVEKQIRYNIKNTEVEETVVDENGEEKKVKKCVEVIEHSDYRPHSEFSRFFDASSPYWEKDSEYNRMFLEETQKFFNKALRHKGIIFLNEVYEKLGFEPTKAGQVVGWVYDDRIPPDEYQIDFGIYNGKSENVRRFINGYEAVVLLDFNVDGDVWRLM